MPLPHPNVAESILSGGRPEAPALLFGNDTLTYAELREAAHGWTARLLESGAAHGQRVGLFAENGPFFVAAYLGTIRAGLCVVPFQVDCGQQAFEQIVASTGMTRMLVSARFLDKVRPLAEKFGVQLLVEGGNPTHASEDAPALPEIEPRRDLAAIMYTSGSTGQPKGVMVTHANMACNTHDIVEYMHLGPADRVMAVLPFYYCYGVSLLHTTLAAGGSLVLNNRFMFPEKVLDEIEAKQCTGFAGVPSTYQILLRKTRFAERSFTSLRWLQQAGGKLPDPFLREIREALPEVKLFVMYGQTEATARLSYLPPELLDEKLGSIGRGLPGVRLEVLKPDGTPVRPGSDEVGEIVAAGESITPGYWADPEETQRYFRQGKLHTGDMARVDQDGYIYLVERVRDFIKSMGNRVSPKEIEDVIAEMPQVVEVAVIGVPDDLWGEAVKAFLVLTEPEALKADDVRAHCLKQLPNYKVPQQIELLPRLPKTSNGKIAKEQLKSPRGPISSKKDGNP